MEPQVSLFLCSATYIFVWGQPCVFLRQLQPSGNLPACSRVTSQGSGVITQRASAEGLAFAASPSLTTVLEASLSSLVQWVSSQLRLSFPKFIFPLICCEDGGRQRKGRYSGLWLCFLICYSPVLARASPVWGLRTQTEWWSSALTPRAAEDWRWGGGRDKINHLCGMKHKEAGGGLRACVCVCACVWQTKRSNREQRKWGNGRAEGLVDVGSGLNPGTQPKRSEGHLTELHRTALCW